MKEGMGRYHHFAIVCILKMNRNVYFFEFTGWYLVSSVGLGNSYMFEQVRVVNSIRMLLSPSSRQYITIAISGTPCHGPACFAQQKGTSQMQTWRKCIDIGNDA